MCIVIPGEETTRTGVKYTGYIQTLVPQDDGKPASYFNIAFTYNGLDHYITCLPEPQEELEHALQGIMTCFKDAKHYINLSLSVLPPESEGTDIMLSIKKSVKEMAADLQLYESGTGKKKVRKLGSIEKSSESKKSKPGESSGETGHARPRSQLRLHQRRPGTDTPLETQSFLLICVIVDFYVPHSVIWQVISRMLILMVYMFTSTVAPSSAQRELLGNMSGQYT